jgi:uncharacterized OB-fold protein
MFDDEGLLGGRCTSCTRTHFPLAGHCPWCGSAEVGEHRLSTEGTLWAWTTVHAPPPGYDGPVPFGFGVVELPADGLRVITRITETDHERCHLGQAVRYTVSALDDTTTVWSFAPVADAAPTGTTGAGR